MTKMPKLSSTPLPNWWSRSLSVLVWSVVVTGCKGDAPSEDEPTKVAQGAEASPTASKQETPTDDPTPLEGDEGEEAPPSATKLDVGTAGAADEGAPEEPSNEEAGEPAEGDPKADEDDGGAAGEPEQPALDTGKLLAEVRSKKTTDERALEALAEAKEAGAGILDLAKAANARGEALYASPERATKFFEWSAEQAPKYPVPVFNLAKQAAVKGDVDEVKKYLVQVHERGGHKLLSQIEFDPMWEIVKDDPDVRKLL